RRSTDSTGSPPGSSGASSSSRADEPRMGPASPSCCRLVTSDTAVTSLATKAGVCRTTLPRERCRLALTPTLLFLLLIFVQIVLADFSPAEGLRPQARRLRRD